jgi:hypothetical protein
LSFKISKMMGGRGPSNPSNAGLGSEYIGSNTQQQQQQQQQQHVHASNESQVLPIQDVTAQNWQSADSNVARQQAWQGGDDGSGDNPGGEDIPMAFPQRVSRFI